MNFPQLALVLPISVCLVGPWPGQDRPRALVMFERYRAGMETGHISWSSITERPDGTKRQVFWTSRFAGQDTLRVNRGDADGVVVRYTDGSLPRGGHDSLNSLRKDGWYYKHRDEEPTAMALRLDGRVAGAPDLRSLGALPWHARDSIHDTLWTSPLDQPEGFEYEEAREGDLHIVTRKMSTGSIRWWIDPSRGWAPIRVASYDPDGILVSESRSTLRKFGDTWFPETVAFFSRGHDNGESPRVVVRINNATFNAADHPMVLGLSDIGVDVGMRIKRHDGGFRYLDSVVWDGEKLISNSEYNERRRAGELPASATAARWAARVDARRAAAAMGSRPPGSRRSQDAIANSKSKPESEWEAYTRRFIDRYSLSDAQTQKAMGILKDCQERGDRYLKAHKGDMDRNERESLKARAEGAAGKDHLTALEIELRDLRKPIDDIFENQLKPRLETLPTRSQRARAESADPSKATEAKKKVEP